MADANLIEIIGLQKRFGAVAALHGMDLAIREGEFFTLLGPSGCGKTTTLRLVGGLERPDGGTIAIDGRRVAGADVFVNPEKRNIGMVFQSYALWPHMTVFENVAYPLKLRGAAKAEIRSKVGDALALVGLAGLADRPAPALSGGQQQRVALARALVFTPRLLLLDEPLSNLDAQLRDDMRKELKALQRRLGLTVLMVTHDQVEALGMSDRVGIMDQGRLEQVDTPEAVYHAPATPFVRDFLGRMFVLTGTVVAATETLARVAVGGASAPLSIPRTLLRAGESGELVGRTIALAIRPEQIAVADRIDGPSTLRFVVSGRQFLGDRCEYAVSDGVDTCTLTLSAAHSFRAGEEIFLTLRPEKITVWDAEQRRTAEQHLGPARISLERSAEAAPVRPARSVG